jgi:hypothetical protein
MTGPKYIKAPTVQANSLWNMSPADFNNWRRKNDYPRIISFLHNKLPLFDEWMIDQELSDAILIEHSPSSFLRERDLLFLYTIINKDSIAEHMLLQDNYDIGDTFFHQNYVKEKQIIIPYPNWYNKRKTSKEILSLSLTSRSGRSHYFMGELELIDLGNKTLNSIYLGGRILDFVSIDDLQIKYVINNKQLRIWFSSATNLSVEGDLAFIDAYNTSFYESWNSKYSNLKLSNGTFQDWSFENCGLNLNASNATLFRWSYNGYQFNGTLSNTDIRESKFSSKKPKYSIDFGRNKEFHAHVKIQYSQIGKRKEASSHYYLEKKYERKSYLRPKANYRDQFYSIKQRSKWLLLLFFCKYLFKYLYSGLLNVLWGYGEKPGRIFIISIIAICSFALIFYCSPASSTALKGNIINSLYYSLVTFTTLGSGEIVQTDYCLKLLTGLEALLGMSFWGILIAGFTNNSKDY